MLKLAKITNNETGLCSIALSESPDNTFFTKNGYLEQDVEQSITDNQWYLVEKLNTTEYLSQKSEKVNEIQTSKIKQQILQIEAQQARALREVLLTNCEYSKTKLESIENQIQELRTQL